MNTRKWESWPQSAETPDPRDPGVRGAGLAVPYPRKGNRVETSIKRRTDLTVRDLGSDMILYDESTETFHILNGAARSIWLLLDGESASASIQEKYVSLYPAESRSRLESDLVQTLKEFRQKGLLRNGA